MYTTSCIAHLLPVQEQMIDVGVDQALSRCQDGGVESGDE
jgi:hypothetical protein